MMIDLLVKAAYIFLRRIATLRSNGFLFRIMAIWDLNNDAIRFDEEKYPYSPRVHKTYSILRDISGDVWMYTRKIVQPDLNEINRLRAEYEVMKSHIAKNSQFKKNGTTVSTYIELCSKQRLSEMECKLSRLIAKVELEEKFARQMVMKRRESFQRSLTSYWSMVFEETDRFVTPDERALDRAESSGYTCHFEGYTESVLEAKRILTILPA